MRAAVPLRRGWQRGCAGADHAGAPRAAHREQAAPVGAAHHVHRAHQEPEVQLLGPLVHEVRPGHRTTLRVRG